MKVLFISSGNSESGISPIVFNQGESLKKAGIEVSYFTIKGKGFKGYLNNVPKIRKYIKKHHFDLIHAHYSLTAFAVSLSFPNIPIVVSIMGSDSRMSMFWKTLIKIFSFFQWEGVIVKSDEIKRILHLKNAFVIPNGVNLHEFKSKSKIESQKIVGFDSSKKNIVFLSNPFRYEKNYFLAEKAIKFLRNKAIDFHIIYNKAHDEIVHFLSAADVILLTSFWEGSPNIIKEAMACNCPIVATDVGDVKYVIGDTDGCYITSFDPEDVAEKLKLALKFAEEKGRTNGRDRIIKLGLDSDTIAKRIVGVYKNVLNTKNV